MPDMSFEAVVVEEVEQPLEERLHPQSDLHRRILYKLQQWRDYSDKHIAKRYSTWDETRAHLGMYLDIRRAAKLGDGTYSTEQKEMPRERSIKIPASFAIHQTLLSQLMSIYATRVPYFPIRGIGAEDIRGAYLIEAMFDHDMRASQTYAVLYSMFSDQLAFGMAPLYDYWTVEEGYVSSYAPVVEGVDPEILEMVLGDLAWRPTQEWGIKDEGNRWRSIDPYNFFPDPRVPLSRVQEGEFVTFRFRPSVLSLRSKEGIYFNLEHIGWTSSFTQERSTLLIDQDVSEHTDDQYDHRGGQGDRKKSGFIEAYHTQCKIIPRDWGLGAETRPEHWLFTWVEPAYGSGGSRSGVIIRAHRCTAPHQQFSISIAESVPDFHNHLSPGLMELADGPQRFMDWAFASRYASVMSTLNPRFIYGASLVNLTDMEYGGIGEGIRLTAEGENALLNGRISNIGALLQQLPVADITANHQQLVDYLYQQTQIMLGSNDPMMGINVPGDTTATEVGVLTRSATMKLQTLAQLTSTVAIKPAVQRGIANRQFLTSIDRFFRLLGQSAKDMGTKVIRAGARDIQGGYDYEGMDWVLGGDPARDSMVFSNLAEAAGSLGLHQIPGADGRVVDLRALFEEAAFRSGVRDFDRFLVTMQQQQQAPPQAPEVVPDEMIQQQVDAGNMVPIDQSMVM